VAPETSDISEVSAAATTVIVGRPIDGPSEHPAVGAEPWFRLSPLGFDLRVTATSTRIGEPGIVAIEVHAASGWHLNLDYPTAIRFQATKDLALGRQLVDRTGADRYDEKIFRFLVPVSPRSSGDKKLIGELSLGLCQDAQSCVAVKHPIRAVVRVRE